MATFHLDPLEICPQILIEELFSGLGGNEKISRTIFYYFAVNPEFSVGKS